MGRMALALGVTIVVGALGVTALVLRSSTPAPDAVPATGTPGERVPAAAPG